MTTYIVFFPYLVFYGSTRPLRLRRPPTQTTEAEEASTQTKWHPTQTTEAEEASTQTKWPPTQTTEAEEASNPDPRG